MSANDNNRGVTQSAWVVATELSRGSGDGPVERVILRTQRSVMRTWPHALSILLPSGIEEIG